LSYIKGVPRPKITRFEFGKKDGKFDSLVTLCAIQKGYIRHNALEAGRVVLCRHLEPLGSLNYFAKIKKYPFQVLRENAIATGAGADRFQEGMRRAYGKPIGTAAFVDLNDVIIEVKTTRRCVDKVRTILKKVAYKFGILTRVQVKDI
jgi:large subunit ribosomal protein L10e